VKRTLVGALGLSLLLSATCRADPAEAQRQTQRALMDRDRQAAEFSRPELRDMPRRGDAEPPLPLPLSIPRGPGQAIDPIAVQGSRS
jgi:hypothetical protein